MTSHVQLNWADIETVLLDMDGTLLDLHFDNYFWLTLIPTIYAEREGICFDDALAKVTALYNQQKGSINWYCLDYWSEQLQLDMMTIKQSVSDKITIRPHVKAFLAGLRAHQKAIILLTNAHGDNLSLKMERTQLSRYFDAEVTTHIYGKPKEAIAFWHSFANDYHYDAKHTLLIDDTESILQTAQHFGIAHLLGMRQPDSRKPIRQSTKFPSILHFNEIMPNG